MRKERRIPPEMFFVGSAIFHYLGPAFAVLLFRACRCTRSRMAADCKCGGGVRILETSVAFIQRAGCGRTSSCDFIRHRAGEHEPLFLSSDQSPATRDGGND